MNKEALIEQAIAHPAFTTWEAEAVFKLMATDELTIEVLRLLFPEGTKDCLNVFHRLITRKTEEALEQQGFSSLGVTQKIKTYILTRLHVLQRYPGALRALLKLWKKPQFIALHAAHLFNTVDHAWRLAGDESVDFNFYTKRGTLAAIYSGALGYMALGKPSPEVLQAFVEKELGTLRSAVGAKKTIEHTALKVFKIAKALLS